MSRPFSAPAGTRRYVPREERWATGWAAHPSRAVEPRHTIPRSSQGRGENRGFRDTYLDQHLRFHDHVPGPGAFRAPQDFLPPPAKARAKSRPFSAPTTAAKIFRGSSSFPAAPRGGTRPCAAAPGAGKDHGVPRPGADAVDVKGFYLSRPATPKFSTAARFGKGHSSPNFYTPGPGAYTQFSDFGMLPGMKCTEGAFSINHPEMRVVTPRRPVKAFNTRIAR